MTASKWVLSKQFSGEPTDENLQLVEETLLPLEDGEIKLEALYLSVDPYMRVVETRNDKYPVGMVLFAVIGWRTLTVLHPDGPAVVKPVPDIGNHPLSYALGILGMPGVSAYFGFLEICQPKPGETVLVNAAAGAVGHVVGQLAKIKGCKVVAYAGTDEKCQWLKEELGFDHVFNYKTSDLSTTLKQAAPEGIDCYFDNVGGEFSDEVLTNHMRKYGRISVCGSISAYNNDGENPQGAYLWSHMVFKELSIRGFLNASFSKDHPKGIADLKAWIEEGKIKTRETVTEGFENMREAFYSMLKGGNIGKAVVRVKDTI